MHSKFIILLIFMILLHACQEEFVLDSVKNEKLLVVEGLITNEPGPYTIRLSESSSTTNPVYIPITDCIVTLIEKDGYSEVLLEKSPGIYTSSVGGIQGIVGNEYSLSIITLAGKEYETDFQEIKEPIKIDSVYAELIKSDVVGFEYGLPGFQFYVDTEAAPSQENYFLWNMTETYKYHADYELHAILTRDGLLYTGIDTGLIYNEWQWCWKTQNVNYIFTGKTSELTIPKIVYKPLHLVSTDSRRLVEKYSLLLKQYTIDKAAYYYWNGVEELISEENFFFTTQPYNIVGNIKNVNNEEEIVYGNFTVAAIDQKRIFVDRPNVAFYYSICFVSLDWTEPMTIYVVESDNGLGFVYETCLDCRSKGGVTDKPDFW